MQVLRNHTFRGIESTEEKHSPLKFCDGWILDYSGPGETLSISNIDQSDGLQLTWGPSFKRIRILQHLDLAAIAGAENIAVELRFMSGESHTAAAVEWVAILQERTDGSFSFHSKFPVSYDERDESCVVFGCSPPPAMDSSSEFAIAVQFSPHAQAVSLARADLSWVAPEPAALSGYNGTKQLPDSPATPWLEARALTGPTPAAEIRQSRPATVSNRGTPRKKLAVVAWDLSHNPAGRAFLLCDIARARFDVELIGPTFSRYGDRLWSPLASSPVPTRTFKATNFRDFLKGAMSIVNEVECDAVYVSKARLPSMLLGMLLKHRNRCPAVLDVDDHEASFFAEQSPLSFADAVSGHEHLDEPFEETWTRVAETLIPSFDALTVSNAALQRKFGGMIVRHARDEKVFRRRPSVRARIRREFGIGPEDKAILFMGTPRAHKGIFRICEALERIDDPGLVLVVVGSANDKRIEAQFARFTKARVKLFPDQPWERLSEIVSLADAVCLLQDASSPVAAFQAPAKLTDALALGVPVIATDVAPLRDIPPEVVRFVRSDEELDGALMQVAGGASAVVDKDSVERSYFLQELSYSVNLPRLASAFDVAEERSDAWPDAWSDVLSGLGRMCEVDLPGHAPAWSRKPVYRPAVRRARPFDVALFWKQNDTGLYGRRHDMMLKYLSRHDRIGKIVQFDAPLSLKALEGLGSRPLAGLDEGPLIAQRAISRFLELQDTSKIASRTFIHRDGSAPQSLLGHQLADKKAYVDFVLETLERCTSGAPLVGLVCPVVFDFPAIARHAGFSLIVADIIDDQRVMTAAPSHRDALRRSYNEILALADVAIANCRPAAEAFSWPGGEVHVVPNAAEIFPVERRWDRPHELACLSGPIVGYVGNLRDRIDVELLDLISAKRPDWNLVLIGSAHKDPPVLALRGRPNVHFLGVKQYEEALGYISFFDAAIMPHLINEVSERMNPLKLYVYHSLGVPIVTTRVANIEEVGPYATVADTHEDFVAALDRLVARDSGQHARPAPSALKDISWPDRVEQVIGLIDATIG